MARERNGRNGNVVKWVAILIVLALAVVGWIYNLGIQGEKLKANGIEDEKVHPQVQDIDTRLVRTEENVKSINQNIAEQKSMQQQILDVQSEILWEVKGK